jgi:hypothetical protein
MGQRHLDNRPADVVGATQYENIHPGILGN